MRILNPLPAQRDISFEQECSACGTNLELELSDLRRDGSWKGSTAVWFACDFCDSTQYVTEVRLNKATFDALTEESPS